MQKEENKKEKRENGAYYKLPQKNCHKNKFVAVKQGVCVLEGYFLTFRVKPLT